MKTSEQKTVSPRTKTCSALLQTAATGELEGDYRRIVYVVQENRLGPTGKSIWSYREIAWGLQENPFRNTGFLRCLNVGSKVWTVKRSGAGATKQFADSGLGPLLGRLGDANRRKTTPPFTTIS